MVSQAIETPVTTDQELVVVEQTEVEEVVEAVPDAAVDEAAAVTQVQVTEEKPDYMTRADWEKEKAEVAAHAASDALESDRRRRQTENARLANQQKRDQDDRAELIDTAKAAFGAAGIYEVPDEALTKAVDRMVRKRSDQLSAGSLDAVDAAWDYLTAPAYGKNVELDDSFEMAAKRLGPKVQHLVNAIRPGIEAEARKGYIAEADLPKRYEAMDAARAAKGREGKEELKRVDGGATSSLDRSHTATIDRIARGTFDATDQQYWDQWDAARRK